MKNVSRETREGSVRLRMPCKNGHLACLACSHTICLVFTCFINGMKWGYYRWSNIGEAIEFLVLRYKSMLLAAIDALHHTYSNSCFRVIFRQQNLVWPDAQGFNRRIWCQIKINWWGFGWFLSICHSTNRCYARRSKDSRLIHRTVERAKNTHTEKKNMKLERKKWLTFLQATKRIS